MPHSVQMVEINMTSTEYKNAIKTSAQ